MNTCLFTACTLAAVLLPAAARAADTPAVTAVRQFLAERASSQDKAAYARLSADSQRYIPAAPFALGDPPQVMDRSLPEVVQVVIYFFWDVHTQYDLSSLIFSVSGADPADPQVVLVRAVSVDAPDPAHAPAATLRVLTVRDPLTQALRLDLVGSMQKTAPGTALLTQRLGRMVSLSNLTALAIGIVSFAQDHDLRLPDAAHWTDQIKPYVKNDAAFRDPSAPAGQQYSYAYNRALSRKVSMNLENPDATVLVFESTKSVKNASDTGQSVPHPGRHLGGTGYAFVSGHVKWLKDGTRPSFKLSGK